ncbi:MAG: hypothetical protein AAF850_07515 [Pseudomonadota bacterium]
MTPLVEIARSFDPEPAFVKRSYLQANGVFVVLLNAQHLGVDPNLRIALGGYRLAVPAAQAVLARSLLDSVQTPETQEDLDYSTAAGRKPEWKKNWYFMLAALMFGIPFLPLYHSRRVMLLQNFAITPVYLIALFLWLFVARR